MTHLNVYRYSDRYNYKPVQMKTQFLQLLRLMNYLLSDVHIWTCTLIDSLLFAHLQLAVKRY